MKHSKPWSMLILILLALLLNAARNGNAASGNERRNQHKAHATPAQKHIQNQQPQIPVVPLSVLESVEAALRESTSAVKEQAIAAEKQAQSSQQTFCSPAVLVNEVLALIGFGYLTIMFLQWKAINKSIQQSEEALRVTQRAEVSLGRPDGKVMELDALTVGKNLGVKMFFFNSGRTAAQDFRTRAMISYGKKHPSKGVDLRPEPVRKSVFVQGYPATTGPITSTVGAGSVITEVASSEEPLTEDEVDSIQKGDLFILITGKFEYTDGFGRDEWRTFQAGSNGQEFLVMDGPFQGGRGWFPPRETDPA